MLKWAHYARKLDIGLLCPNMEIRPRAPINGIFQKFFPGPLAFCKKAVERVRSEKNILNSSVEWGGHF